MSAGGNERKRQNTSDSEMTVRPLAGLTCQKVHQGGGNSSRLIGIAQASGSKNKTNENKRSRVPFLKLLSPPRESELGETESKQKKQFFGGRSLCRPSKNYESFSSAAPIVLFGLFCSSRRSRLPISSRSGLEKPRTAAAAAAYCYSSREVGVALTATSKTAQQGESCCCCC
jgi:hypothetical protein